MSQCTWQDPPDQRCPLEALHPQIAKDGEEWANLCQMHKVVLDAAMPSDDPDKKFNPAEMLRCWVRAGGGAKVITGRMVR